MGEPTVVGGGTKNGRRYVLLSDGSEVFLHDEAPSPKAPSPKAPRPAKKHAAWRVPSPRLPIAAAGQAALGTLSQALTADLLVARTQLRAKPTRKRPDPTPVELELHLNPFALGAMAVGAGLALWLMQVRVGLDEVPYGHWEWPDGAAASRSIPLTEKNTQPSRLKYGAPPEPTLREEGHENESVYEYSMRKMAWLIANTEVATWVSDGVKTVPGLKQRPGFTIFGGPGGAGESMSNVIEAWTRPWTAGDVFWQLWKPSTYFPLWGLYEAATGQWGAPTGGQK